MLRTTGVHSLVDRDPGLDLLVSTGLAAAGRAADLFRQHRGNLAGLRVGRALSCQAPAHLTASSPR